MAIPFSLLSLTRNRETVLFMENYRVASLLYIYYIIMKSKEMLYKDDMSTLILYLNKLELNVAHLIIKLIAYLTFQ